MEYVYSLIQKIMSDNIDFPAGILAETTLRCPADCAMCPNKKINNRPRDMSWRLFKKIVDDCRGKQVSEFCPFVHGEPLSWKYLEKGLEYLSQTIPDTSLTIYTNGYLLDSKMSQLLLRHNTREINFSIDGLTKQVYEQHRRGLIYERVLGNTMSFLSEILNHKPRISTHVAFTLTKQNQHEVEAFRSFWESLVDRVDIIPCDGRGGEERLPAYADGSRLPCFQTNSHTYILSDGSVVPCCKDWAGYSVMGNVTDTSLESIWNSDMYKAFRDDIYKGNLPDAEVCQRCVSDRL